MSYRIEYLTETTDEGTVCHSMQSSGGDLDAVEREAFANADMAKDRYGATGFQIRHMNAVDKVVAIAEFDD